MRSRIFVGMLVIFALGLLLVPPGAKASSSVWQKRTTVRFSQPFEIPGELTLPAGTYVFKLVDSSLHQEIVQIANADETHVYAMLRTIPSERVHISDKTVMGFRETGAGFPKALQTWYPPAEKAGHEFAYANR